ncbi:MAG: superoxide dismutase family protein [Flavobacteriaceae bacterium]
MRSIIIVIFGILIGLGYGCKETKKGAEKEMKEVENVEEEVTVEKVSFTMQAKSGSEVSGMVTFTEENDKVTMRAELKGLSPGEHAIHLHEKADCSSDDGKSSGGHWNPTAQPHGKWGASEGFHRGDIGNFVADEDGSATVEFSTDLWCLGCADDSKNILGKAVIVHQGVDDFTSQPSGAAGARISCTGIIE